MQAPRQHQELLDRLKSALPDLQKLLDEADGQWVGEDLVYRFWHQSFKVYGLQSVTDRIVAALEAVAPADSLHPWFSEIVAAGTGQTFDLSHNKDWLRHAKPIVDAFFHARYMLEQAVRYASELDTAPSLLPSGWAALLELYGIR